MRFAFALPALILCVFAGESLAGLVQTSEPVFLSESQRAAVEKVACANSPGKTAVSIQGFRSLWKHKKLGAIVQCLDGVELDAYRAYFERPCLKNLWRWTCEPPEVRLHIKLAGGGPYQIRLEGVSLEGALRGMSCLETVLSQNPKVLDGFNAERIPGLSAVEARPELLRAYLEAHGECYWVEYPRQCNVNAAESLPVSITSGCMNE